MQITKEHLTQPRIAVGRIHRALVESGCTGPPPKFGDLWRALFRPLSDFVGPARPACRVG